MRAGSQSSLDICRTIQYRYIIHHVLVRCWVLSRRRTTWPRGTWTPFIPIPRFTTTPSHPRFFFFRKGVIIPIDFTNQPFEFFFYLFVLCVRVRRPLCTAHPLGNMRKVCIIHFQLLFFCWKDGMVAWRVEHAASLPACSEYSLLCCLNWFEKGPNASCWPQVMSLISFEQRGDVRLLAVGGPPCLLMATWCAKWVAWQIPSFYWFVNCCTL